MGTNRQELWGILGGMGPRASAEFLKTIYEDTAWSREQDAPRVVLLSDPSMPDRTESLLAGQHDQLRERLAEGIHQLLALGATKVIVCCVTIHPLLDELPPEWRSRIVSLVDLIFEGVMQRERRHLLICTEGARRARLFERHRLWPAACHRIVLPAEDDQRQIHELLYAIKAGRHDPASLGLIDDLIAAYGVSAYIAGCTESHILAKEHERLGARRDLCLDPLRMILPMMTGVTQ